MMAYRSSWVASPLRAAYLTSEALLLELIDGITLQLFGNWPQVRFALRLVAFIACLPLRLRRNDCT